MTELNLDDPDLGKKLEDALESTQEAGPYKRPDEEWDQMPIWEALLLLQRDFINTTAPTGWWRGRR